MACIQYPRKERGGVNPGSWEKPTIYRDPPKEIMTRKKERIEEGDVTYNIRNQPDRYNDAITNWQKGKNMMVKVDYQNRTQQMTTMDFGSASNPYKVNQAFRPPSMRQVDLQPLSRQQRPYTAAQTNIGSLMTRDDNGVTRIDQSEIAFTTNVQPIYKEASATVSREMGIYADNFERKDMINDNYVAKQVISKLKGIESVELQKLFSYENTPNGIILTPLMISASASMNGSIQVDSQRHLIDESSYVQEQLKAAIGSNITGSSHVDGQRNLTDVQSYLQQQLLTSLGSNRNSLANTESQYHISDEQAYLQEQLIIALSSVIKGAQSVDGQRHISDEQAYLHEQLLIAIGVNQNGLGYTDSHRVNDEHSYIQDAPLSVPLGTNIQGHKSVHGQMAITDEQAYIQEQLYTALGTNIQGHKSVQGQMTITDEQAYIQEQLYIALGANITGSQHVTNQRQLPDELSYVQSIPQVGLGVNQKSTSIQGQFYIDENAFLQPVQYIGQGVNTSAQASISSQPDSTTFYIKEDGTLSIGLGSNIQGVQQTNSSLGQLSDEQRYLQEQLKVGLGSNTSGVKQMGSRFMNEQSYLTYLKQLGLGVNQSGTQRHGERHMNEQSYVQEKDQIGMGSNTNSIQVNGTVDHQEKVKEILLKNMSSTVSIVIQSGSSTDEYQINGSIQDKIGIVVNSSKGTPLVFHKDNGEPIRLKEYTWKFIKSASGSDRFVIQVPQELELERKSELYSISANPSQSSSLSVNDDVNLRREMRPMSAATNLILTGDIKRVDESVFTNRVEKHTMYTDMMVQSVHPTMNRSDGSTDAIRPHQSVKKQNITQTILRQSQGRFD